MKFLPQPKKLPAALTAGSFLCILVVAALTNPANNIIFIAIFFIALLIFLISLGYLLESLRKDKAGAKHYRVIIISLFIVIFLMFRSSRSLSWVDGLILLLTVGGIIFYADRRFN